MLIHFHHRLFRNITRWTDGEMVADANIDNTPDTLLSGWQARAIKCHSDMMELPVSARFLLFFKMSVRGQPPQRCVYCPWNAGVTHFSPARYFVLTLQISCMQCGGVALYAEYQKTHTSSGASYLSRAFGSVSAPSKKSRVPATIFARGAVSAQLRNKNMIFMDNWHSEKLTNTLLWLYSLMSSFYLFLSGCSGLFRGERSLVWGWWIPQRATTVP